MEIGLLENIEGDVTSCKIENVLVKTYRKGVFSMSQQESYMSYNNCTKEVLAEYDIPTMTVLGGACTFFGFFIILIFLINICSR